MKNPPSTTPILSSPSPRSAWIVVAAVEILGRVRYDTMAAPARNASTTQRTPVGGPDSPSFPAPTEGGIGGRVAQASRKRSRTFAVILDTESSTRIALGQV